MLRKKGHSQFPSNKSALLIYNNIIIIIQLSITINLARLYMSGQSGQEIVKHKQDITW